MLMNSCVSTSCHPTFVRCSVLVCVEKFGEHVIVFLEAAFKARYFSAPTQAAGVVLVVVNGLFSSQGAFTTQPPPPIDRL